MPSGNEAIIRRYFDEAVNQGKFDVIDQHFAPDVVFDTPIGQFQGQEGVKQLVSGFRGAFSDLYVAVEEVFGDGDRFAVRVTTNGTNDGELLGNPPTGRSVKLPFVHFVTFVDGKYARDHVVYDRLALLEQLQAT